MKLWCVWDWKSNERKEDRPHTNSYPDSPNVGYSNPHNSVRFPQDNWVITNHNSFSLDHLRSFYNQFSFPTLSLDTIWPTNFFLSFYERFLQFFWMNVKYLYLSKKPRQKSRLLKLFLCARELCMLWEYFDLYMLASPKIVCLCFAENWYL